jgi:predicted ATPase/class 3 adenylate cyclase
MEDIASWLKTLRLEQYAACFAENDINFAILSDLNDQDLKEIGVSSLGHRRQLLRAIAERKQAAKSASNTVSPTVVLPHEPATTAPRVDAAERRQLTVMFCDLVGSTGLSTRLDPEDLRSIITAYHHCCTEIVQRNGGFAAKFMGDGVLAYFGYPQAHEHDAERAVRAGLNLVETVPKLTTHAGSPLQVRVGIATGLVVVGDLIGTGAAQEQAVVGETPNLAARLQALAEPGAVVIASSTRRLTGGLFEYRDLGTVSLKGFAENVPAWQVLGAGAAESRFEALRTTTMPLVGRDEEIELLLRRWEQVKKGEGCVVLISGEPGIGKSRIAQTIVERLSSEPHTRLRYFCSPHHQDSALYPSIAQLERAAGFARKDTDEQRLAKLETVLAQGTNDLSQVVPLLAELLSVPTGDRYPSLNLTPQKRKEKTLHAQLAQVEGLAAQQPVLMVWEDVHWSDPTTRESLDLLIDRVPTLRVLVMITFRAEFAPPWVGRSHVTMLILNRLPPRQRAEMIVHITNGKVLPKDIADQIVDRTDGVPLFIEELTKAVVESGILVEAGDRYSMTGPVATLAIPTTLQASLLARLDRLATTREVAQIAAALGRQFSHELISAVAQMPQTQLDDALAQLVRAELMFRRGTPPDAEYTFKHALVQDAAYSTLLRSRRQHIHGQIVRSLEEQFPEVVTTQPELLGQHCAQAGLREKATSYWLKAGQQAVARSAMTEAVAQLQRGLHELATLPDGQARQQHELDLRIALATALSATRGYSVPYVGETYARARALAEELNRSDCLLPLLFGQWVQHLVRGEHRLAIHVAGQMEKTGQARHDVAAQFLGRLEIGVTRFSLGEFMAALTSFEQYGDYGNSADRAVFTPAHPNVWWLGYLALTLTYLGHLDQGRLRKNQTLSEARQRQHAYSTASALHYACWVEQLVGSTDNTEQLAMELVALSNEQGFADRLGWGLFHRGWSMTGLDRANEGLCLLTKGLSVYRAIGAVYGTPMMLLLQAECYGKLGRPSEGLNCVAEAAQIIKSTDERRDEAEVYRLRGDLLKTMDDRAAAEHNYREGLAVAARQSAKLFELRAATGLARLWRDQGKRTEARNLLAPIHGWFTEGFDTPVLQDAKALLSELT